MASRSSFDMALAFHAELDLPMGGQPQNLTQERRRCRGSARTGPGEPVSMKCADVTFDMRGEGYDEPAYLAEVGDLVWNPKAGEGHVIVAEVPCGTRHNGHLVDCGCGGWVGPCTSLAHVCECGQDDSWRDHHYFLLARVHGDQDASS